MGLFDHIRCEMELPGDPPPPNGTVFQTKDFDDPYMENYRITSDGRLMHETYVVENQSDPKAPRGSMASLYGCMTHVPTGEEEIPYHGDLHFYHGEWEDKTQKHRKWWSYIARFTEGRCVRIWSNESDGG